MLYACTFNVLSYALFYRHGEEHEAHEAEMQHMRARAMTNAEQFAAALLVKERDLERQEAEVSMNPLCLHMHWSVGYAM